MWLLVCQRFCSFTSKPFFFPAVAVNVPLLIFFFAIVSLHNQQPDVLLHRRRITKLSDRSHSRSLGVDLHSHESINANKPNVTPMDRYANKLRESERCMPCWTLYDLTEYVLPHLFNYVGEEEDAKYWIDLCRWRACSSMQEAQCPQYGSWSVQYKNRCFHNIFHMDKKNTWVTLLRRTRWRNIVEHIPLKTYMSQHTHTHKKWRSLLCGLNEHAAVGLF